MDGDPGSVTACNCTVCRRYGVLWAYDYENERIKLLGNTRVYIRTDIPDRKTEFHYCPDCACVVAWRARGTEPNGRRRIAVNIRLAPPEAVASLPVRHFDGLERFERLQGRDKCVRDMWA